MTGTSPHLTKIAFFFFFSFWGYDENIQKISPPFVIIPVTLFSIIDLFYLLLFFLMQRHLFFRTVMSSHNRNKMLPKICQIFTAWTDTSKSRMRSAKHQVDFGWRKWNYELKLNPSSKEIYTQKNNIWWTIV